MLKPIVLLAGAAWLITSCTQPQPNGNDVGTLLPTPAEAKIQSGVFSLKNDLSISVSDTSLLPAASYLKDILKYAAPDARITEGKGDISLLLEATDGVKGAYRLHITSGSATVSANDYTGIINGISTVRQLLSPDTETAEAGGKTYNLPATDISDAPKFEWRGIMMDAARHFWSKEEVKGVLDLMAQYKLNKFHWHLTDDQGWRIEIKKYPLLTEKGAWRTFNNHDRECLRLADKQDNTDYLIPSDKLKITEKGDTLYGGFYTQNDIREIVSYAAQRGIEVIPEVDMPGHFLAAIGQYPELACKGLIGWGALFSSPICPGKDSTLEFCKNVYKEVFQLFPTQFVHMGGDEVDKSNWHKCADCRKRVAQEKLSDPDQLQAWFVRNMEQFFRANGKRMIGWDEVVEDGLSGQAVIMWWRSWAKDAVPKAVIQNKEVILTPNYCFYFDYQQDKNTIKQILAYDPYEKIADPSQHKLVKGIQANVWAEYIPSMKRWEYMVAPRIMALSEIAWGQNPQPDEEGFWKKAGVHFQRFDKQGINYRIPDLQGFYNRNVFTDRYTLKLASAIPGVEVRYTTDGTIPTAQSARYKDSLLITESGNYKFRTFRPDGTPCDYVSAEFVRESYAPACEVPEKAETGLQAAWFDYKGSACSDITKATFKGNYAIDRVCIPKGVEGNIGLVIKGYIDVPADDVYTFSLFSDDGSMMYIDGAVTIDNDGAHSPKEVIGQKALAKGLHPIEVRYFDHNGGVLELNMIDKQGNKTPVPQQWFKMKK